MWMCMCTETIAPWHIQQYQVPNPLHWRPRCRGRCNILSHHAERGRFGPTAVHSISDVNHKHEDLTNGMIFRKYFLSRRMRWQMMSALGLWASAAVMSDCFTKDIESVKSRNMFSNNRHARTFLIESVMTTQTSGRWLVNRILVVFSMKTRSVSTGHLKGGGGGGSVTLAETTIGPALVASKQ